MMLAPSHPIMAALAQGTKVLRLSAKSGRSEIGMMWSKWMRSLDPLLAQLVIPPRFLGHPTWRLPNSSSTASLNWWKIEPAGP